MFCTIFKYFTGKNPISDSLKWEGHQGLKTTPRDVLQSINLSSKGRIHPFLFIFIIYHLL